MANHFSKYANGSQVGILNK